jgi:hypothetical protein
MILGMPPCDTHPKKIQKFRYQYLVCRWALVFSKEIFIIDSWQPAAIVIYKYLKTDIPEVLDIAESWSQYFQ